jgi:hypothetical protein
VQVDPIKPTLKAPKSKRLKLKYDELLSNVASKFNLRRFTKVAAARSAAADAMHQTATLQAGRQITLPTASITLSNHRTIDCCRSLP